MKGICNSTSVAKCFLLNMTLCAPQYLVICQTKSMTNIWVVTWYKLFKNRPLLSMSVDKELLLLPPPWWSLSLPPSEVSHMTVLNCHVHSESSENRWEMHSSNPTWRFGSTESIDDSSNGDGDAGEFPK